MQAKKAIKAQKKALAALEPGAEAPTAETPETRPATQEELDAALKRARVKMFSQPPEHMWYVARPFLPPPSLPSPRAAASALCPALPCPALPCTVL